MEDDLINEDELQSQDEINAGKLAAVQAAPDCVASEQRSNDGYDYLLAQVYSSASLGLTTSVIYEYGEEIERAGKDIARPLLGTRIEVKGL